MAKQRRSRTREQEIDREIQDHLELEAAELRQTGMADRDAVLVARRSLGNTTLIGEELRAMWTRVGLEQLVQDGRYAFRSLRKNPGFSTVALLSLALGIGANTAIFTFVNAALLKPLPYPDAGRIVALRQRPLHGETTTAVAPRSFVPWRDRAKSFEALTLAQAIPINAAGIDGAEQVPGLWITPEFLRVFGVQPMLGRGFTSDEGIGRGAVLGGLATNENTILLSHGYWQRRYGSDPRIVGQTVPIGRGSAVVAGVMPRGFRVGTLNVDIYTPMQIERNGPDAVGSRGFLCFGRLWPGVSLQAARAEMAVIAAQVAREVPAEKDYGVVVLGLRDFLVSDNRTILLILAGVVGFVLLIACANVASLLLTRGVGRQSELAVRAALGAGRRRIIQQMGVESLVLSILGGALGLFLGWGGSRVLAVLAEGAVDFGQMADVSLDVRVLAFTLTLCCLTALLFGVVPAWRASRIDLQSRLKSQGRGNMGAKGQDRMRSALVVAEVALAVILLVGAGLFLRTFSNLVDVKLGFQPENAITMRTLVTGTPAARAGMVDSILDRVEVLPGVRAAGTIQFLPLAGFTNQGPFHFVGRQRLADMESDVSTVSRGYFAAIGMELLRGRAFGREDRLESQRVALVNQAFVNRYSREDDPLGRLILGDWSNPKPTEIVGVVADIRHNGLTAEPRPTVFLCQSQHPGYMTYVVVRTANDPAALTSAVRHEVRQIDPRQPFTDVQPLSQYVSKARARPRLYANFVGAFAALALFLAAIGLYGLLAYAVSQHTHEIGLRIAMGAPPNRVLASTILQGARLVGVGLALGIAGAFGLSQMVSRLLYGVRPTDPWTYIGVSGLMAAVALLAAFVPARRAAAVDPIVALRCE